MEAASIPSANAARSYSLANALQSSSMALSKSLRAMIGSHLRKYVPMLPPRYHVASQEVAMIAKTKSARSDRIGRRHSRSPAHSVRVLPRRSLQR